MAKTSSPKKVAVTKKAAKPAKTAKPKAASKFAKPARPKAVAMLKTASKPAKAARPKTAASRQKVAWKPGNIVIPTPAALVSCSRPGATPNLITIAWCGNVNSTPPMLSISVRPERHSHAIIADTGEFVVNLPSTSQARAVDYCGVASGRDVDKFTATGFTPCAVPGVAVPGVAECPISIACRVTQRLHLGSHDMFIAEVVGVAVSAGLLDKAGAFRLEAADLLCYAHGSYFSLGKKRGFFGWSVQKKPAKPRAGRKA